MLALAALLLVAGCERADRATVIQSDSGATAGVDTAVSRPAPGTVVPAPGAERGSDRTADALRSAIADVVRGRLVWSDMAVPASVEIVRTVEVDANGRAVVDFVDLRQIIPNASASAGSQMLLDELNAAVFAVSGVKAVEYRMAGSCELLGEWLQYGVCLRFDRPQ